jgi:hypothetical protein
LDAPAEEMLDADHAMLGALRRRELGDVVLDLQLVQRLRLVEESPRRADRGARRDGP